MFNLVSLLRSAAGNRRVLVCAFLLAFAPAAALAGGPKYIAGTTFFNPGVLGQPVHWAGGQVNYYVDQGPLSASVTNQQATAMVDAAAALWSAIPTAGVTLTNKGPLNEDVSGTNIVASSSQAASQPVCRSHPTDRFSTLYLPEAKAWRA